MTRNDSSTTQDAWLTDFTDQILNGKTDSLPADGPDPETRTLADTLLRLQRAFPEQELDSASMKRIQARVMERWREEQAKSPRWTEIFRLEWLAPSRRQQFGMAFAVLAIASLVIITAPFLFSNSGSLPASAGSETNSTFLWIVLGVAAISIIWLFRRKS
ncbi:MAG: hypothetical protein C4583_04125 [Anaerolineaceae bacterium]|nr:MAG: hypothetical protein C4583_04125 [Anaerolineaceae bacterium]